MDKCCLLARQTRQTQAEAAAVVARIKRQEEETLHRPAQTELLARAMRELTAHFQVLARGAAAAAALEALAARRPEEVEQQAP